MRIAGRQLEGILAHARAGHPYEVCGVLLGRADGNGVVIEEAVAVRNQERAAPRVKYAIAPEDVLRLQREARATGRDVSGFYHSHPDHAARPSETDRRMAAAGLSDGMVYLIVGVDGAGSAVPSAWVFRDALQAFEEEPLEVVQTRDGEGTRRQ